MEINFREVLSLISDIVIPVAGSAITYYQVREARQEKRGRNFVISTEITPEDRGEYAEYCLDLYRRQYASQIRQGAMVVRHLVYPPSWIQPKEKSDFFPLRKVPVTISETFWTAKPPRAGFLPYSREGYTYNKKQLMSNKSLMFNGKLFALEAVTGSLDQGTLAITVKNGGYFDFLDSCEYLVYELSHARKIRRKKPPYHLGLFSPLPCRSRQAELMDLDNRFAGIGVNTATILQNVDSPVDADDPQSPRRKTTYLLLHQRSGKVSEGQGAIHVIPAGSYQPVGPQLRSPFNQDLSNTVYREFGEELLNVDEFSHLGEEGVLEDKYRRWEVLFLGLGFEPVNTKVEVLTAMKVDVDLPENRRLFSGAYTLEGLKSYFQTNYEGSLILSPLTESNLLQYQRDSRTTQSCKEILTIMLEHLDYFQS